MQVRSLTSWDVKNYWQVSGFWPKSEHVFHDMKTLLSGDILWSSHLLEKKLEVFKAPPVLFYLKIALLGDFRWPLRPIMSFRHRLAFSL